jgi:RHS repeat-associated protein
LYDFGRRSRSTGKERDAETGLDYFGARYMSSAQGRFTSPDPTFLNIWKVISPQRWNLYGYATNNPLRYVDPDGQEAIAVVYPGYQVGVRGNFTAPLGHAGVVIVRPDGSTHYFEYGRYEGPDGIVRNAGPNNTPTPSVERDASGRITPESMEGLMASLSNSAGKHGDVRALVFATASIEDMAMEAYLASRESQNSDPQRQKYSIFGGHNCGTLICEAFDAAGHPSPLPLARKLSLPEDIFNELGLHFGPSQVFYYSPKKSEQVTTTFCYSTEDNKQVCQ